MYIYRSGNKTFELTMCRAVLVSWLFRWRRGNKYAIPVVGVLIVAGLCLLFTVHVHHVRNWMNAAPVASEAEVLSRIWLDDETAKYTKKSVVESRKSQCLGKGCASSYVNFKHQSGLTNKSATNAAVLSTPSENARNMSIKETRSFSVYPNHHPVKTDCEWVNFSVKEPPYFLTAVFILRIYENDKSELTSAEVKQWLEYLRYAGVEHVYLYDIWQLPGESQREELSVFIREGYLTYTDWHKYNPYTRMKSQLPAYQHCIDNYGKDSTWQAAIDIDEYPFSPSDTSSGFLHRFVKKYSMQHSDVSEITMKNYLYLGEKDKTKELLIDRLWRHTHGPANPLVKPIYKPNDISSAQIHHNRIRRGHSRDASSGELRMNHYWGARLQNWGPDTKESLTKTEDDRGMEPIVTAFKRCEKYVRPYL